MHNIEKLFFISLYIFITYILFFSLIKIIKNFMKSQTQKHYYYICKNHFILIKNSVFKFVKKSSARSHLIFYCKSLDPKRDRILESRDLKKAYVNITKNGAFHFVDISTFDIRPTLVKNNTQLLKFLIKKMAWPF